MPLKSYTGARFNMNAMLLHQGDYVPPDPLDPADYGEWVEVQDPLTGEIIRIWKPFEDKPDDPSTPDVVDPTFRTIDCLARGIVDGGIRVAGNTERFGDTYENMEYVKLWTPAKVRITKRDRVTNIRTPDGHIRWTDEEFDDPLDLTPPKATVFNVNGVTPLFDAFNKHVENFCLLERAEVSE